MRSITTWRPSPALAFSFVALFVALSGSTLALQTSEVDSKDIVGAQVMATELGEGVAKRETPPANGVTPGEVGSLARGDIGESTFRDPRSDGASPRALAPKCDTRAAQRSARGVYALHGTGTVLGAPFAVAGQLVVDGRGHVSGSLTETDPVHGTVDSNLPLRGTYSIDSDCRGRSEFTVDHEGHTLDFYPSAGGRRFFWILTNVWFKQVAVGDTAIEADPLGTGERGRSDRRTVAVSGVASVSRLPQRRGSATARAKRVAQSSDCGSGSSSASGRGLGGPRR